MQQWYSFQVRSASCNGPSEFTPPLGDGVLSYAWDAESKIKTAQNVNYTYDGDGNRLQKSSGKIYWYGTGSEILDESDASGNITDEFVFFGGKRIAHRVVSTGSIYYFMEDFLGSSRVITTSAGVVCYEADFYPYGGERVITNTCPQNYKFQGKERDTETGNDDFGARYYSSSTGRWLSPDWSAIPAPVPYANLTNPQTLNLYAMVRDNPETFADLDGHYPNLQSPWATTGSNLDQPLRGFRDEASETNSTTFFEDQGEPGGRLPTPADPATWREEAQQLLQFAAQGIRQACQLNSSTACLPRIAQNQPQASWDKTKPLPDDPSKLGPDWKKNPNHQHPHGEEYVNDKTGEKMEWNKGRPGTWGPKSDRGKNGWHYTPPGGVRGKQLEPGQVIKTAAQIAFWGAVGAIIIKTLEIAAEACVMGACY